MNEIKCPKCGAVFQVNENDYASIVNSIRDKVFKEELASQTAAVKARLLSEAALEKERALKAKEQEVLSRNQEITRLQGVLEKHESEQKLAVQEALKIKEDELRKKEEEIMELKHEVASTKERGKTLVREANLEKDQEIVRLKGDAELKRTEFELREKTLVAGYVEKLKIKDEEIAYYRDLKAKLSTKLVGETLEQHCRVQFEQYRRAFPNATFEKDNDARTGSKGDFIFREKIDDVEFISIMFEMKNENDTTATKHRNEDFFKELDKDRKEKKCEYAVLVSLLEAESDLYNAGIVDVFHPDYKKMYVIRPQCFIPMITLLRNAALNSLDYKRELIRLQNEETDVSKFQDELAAFKDSFNANFKKANNHFENAILEIDKTIDHLQKVRASLQGTKNQLGYADKKVKDLSIKKLTRGNKTMKQRFAALEQSGEDD